MTDTYRIRRAAPEDVPAICGLIGSAAAWLQEHKPPINVALHNYYKGQGFEHLRTLQFEDPWEYPSVALFQKPTADVDGTSAAQFSQVSGPSG